MRRALISLALGVMGLLAVVAVAVAAHPIHSATYRGTFRNHVRQSITFRVSANGRFVNGFQFAPRGVIPFGPPCSGGAAFVISRRAAITAAGRFNVALPIVQPTSQPPFRPSKVSIGTLQVTGTFSPGGRARGTITTRFRTGRCGIKLNYTARG